LRRRTLVVARFNRGLEIERISYKLDKASKLLKEFDGFQFLYNSLWVAIIYSQACSQRSPHICSCNCISIIVPNHIRKKGSHAFLVIGRYSKSF
jgi:hypothetical protein